MNASEVGIFPPVICKRAILRFTDPKFDVVDLRLRFNRLCDQRLIDSYISCITMDTIREELHVYMIIRSCKWMNCSYAGKFQYATHVPDMLPVFGDKFIDEWIEKVYAKWPLMNKVCKIDIGFIKMAAVEDGKGEIKPDTEHDREWTYKGRTLSNLVPEAVKEEEEEDDILVENKVQVTGSSMVQYNKPSIGKKRKV